MPVGIPRNTNWYSRRFGVRPGNNKAGKKRYMDGAKADDADVNIRGLIFALLALACGHMLSTLLRTIPAVSLDVMAADLKTPPQTLASLTSIYHFAFAASQIPVGAAMDRFGVRPVSLSLLIGTIVGALASGMATGPESFLFGQFLLGVATSGMLMCPMTLAAKQLSPARFGLWSGLILSIGNIGMLLSSSPLAFVVEQWGWRAGFWISAGFGVAVALAVYALVPNQRAEHADRSSPLSQMASVLRIGLSYRLRGLIAISLVSLAAVLVMRGLWGGPWLMEVKGLSRIEAGNALGLFTIALIVGPAHRHFRSKIRPSPRGAGGDALPGGAAACLDGGGRTAFSGLGSVRRCGDVGSI